MYIHNYQRVDIAMWLDSSSRKMTQRGRERQPPGDSDAEMSSGPRFPGFQGWAGADPAGNSARDDDKPELLL